jgi:molecular chaperone GrpE
MENTQHPEHETQKETQDLMDSTPQESPDSFETLNGTDEPKIQSELKKFQEDLLDAKDKYLRLYSEFENFRRRTAKEKLEMISSANEQVVKSLLPILDDFERAEKAFQGTESKALEGFLLIYNKFKKTVEQTGAKAMDLNAGSDFDADLQEAITQIPAPDESLKGKVVDVIEKGYLLGDKVIRHAKVIIGS